MIKLSHLTYSYGHSGHSDRKAILSDISAEIADGAFCALLGANGSGKTTLLRCIANLLEPTGGSIEIDGRETRKYSIREMARKLALVQQHPQTDMEFSAFETVMMGRNPYQRHLQNESREDRDIVERCMRQTNTWHLRGALPSEMSGGELQRVMIARALAQQTPLLLLDEPTSNLDIAHQFETMELLRDINTTQRKTILIVVHDLNMALRYCPQAMLLHKGGILFHGSASEALQPERIEKVFGVRAERREGYLYFNGRAE